MGLAGSGIRDPSQKKKLQACLAWESLSGGVPHKAACTLPHSVSFPYKTEIPNILVKLFWEISDKM
jgi:hypothetical protein